MKRVPFYFLLFLSLILAVAQAIFTLTGVVDLRGMLVSHTLLVSCFVFVQTSTKGQKSKWIRPFFYFLAATSIVINIWYMVNLQYILTRLPQVVQLTYLEAALGVTVVAIVLVGTWLTVGLAMVVLAAFFLFYAIVLGPFMPGLFATRAIPISELIEYLFFSDSGIFGTPIYVSAVYVYMFMIFGAFLKASGSGKLFTNLALAATGKSTGGAAKSAVIASGLFGTISGSAVANAALVGTLTIPLMVKGGYKPKTAAAIEAVASTGGQLMPPIMGAAAFLMAYILGVSYWAIAVAAVLPSMIYYGLLFISVDLYARRYKISERIEVPPFKQVLSEIFLIIPLLVIIEAIVVQYDVPFAAYLAFLSCIGVWLIRGFKSKRNIMSMILFALLSIGMIARIDILLITGLVAIIVAGGNLYSKSMTRKEVFEAFIDTTSSMGTVAMACACAGIIIGVLTITGLSLRLTAIMTSASGSNIVVLLLLTAVAAYILGMGMPTTAVYITVAVVLTPALIVLHVPPLVAHFFAFYTAMLCMITPPVALATYTTAGIAGENPTAVGFEAMKLGFLLFVLPFLFVSAPALLLIGTPIAIALTFANTFLALFPMAMGFVGYSLRPLGRMARFLYLASAALILYPELFTSLAGIALFAILLFQDLRRRRRLKDAVVKAVQPIRSNPT